MILCVTGPMAAGKNKVSDLLEEAGWFCIDADKAIHKILPDCTEEILQKFSEAACKEGISLKNPDGSLNRRELGKLLFPHPELLKAHEEIVYPKLSIYIEELLKKAEKDGRNAVINAAVMYKTPELLKKCRAVIFVDAPFFVRFVRARKRDGMKMSQIISRFKAQKTLRSEYKALGVKLMTVKNTGSIQTLKKRLLKALDLL